LIKIQGSEDDGVVIAEVSVLEVDSSECSMVNIPATISKGWPFLL